jgi:hypothetical protein
MASAAAVEMDLVTGFYAIRKLAEAGDLRRHRE